MFARTDRLLLRPHWAEDAAAINLMAKTFGDEPGLTGWQCRLPRNPRLPDLLIWRRTAGAPELVGRAGLVDDAGAVELRIWIVPAERRQGLGTEAAVALLEMARFALGLTGLVARADEAGMARLLDRLGFEPPIGGQRMRHCHFVQNDRSAAHFTRAA
jgi:RimJ/RimL family protein N-acetyltransferase